MSNQDFHRPEPDEDVRGLEALQPFGADAVLKRLQGIASNRRNRATSLQSSIKSFFKPALNDKQVACVLQSLADSRKIVIDGAKVTYSM